MPLMRTPSARIGRCAEPWHCLLLLNEGWQTKDICVLAQSRILTCQALGKPIANVRH